MTVFSASLFYTLHVNVMKSFKCLVGKMNNLAYQQRYRHTPSNTNSLTSFVKKEAPGPLALTVPPRGEALLGRLAWPSRFSAPPSTHSPPSHHDVVDADLQQAQRFLQALNDAPVGVTGVSVHSKT